MSQVSSSKTLTLQQFHLPLIAKRSFRQNRETLAKKNYISVTPDQIQFFIFLFYFLCPSLLLQLLISVQQFWQWDQSQSPGINSRPTFTDPLGLPHLQASISLNGPRIPLGFNLVTKPNAYSSLIILQVSTGMQVGCPLIAM